MRRKGDNKEGKVNGGKGTEKKGRKERRGEGSRREVMSKNG